ncbi:hypothetical protein T440DRAFT_458205 [Plenodomus tracheiphilus IPT5]|uniref:Alpha/beta-hydrolase n=1 Tax=Plenodomus tracheiphilus IPT5 TaxID=1408161 RepID=A0A6A7AWK0_9PLEO|nr:hypothetical protein T440DRAFT_458205 [Plenodomus tracheiphilus IPT5]
MALYILGVISFALPGLSIPIATNAAGKGIAWTNCDASRGLAPNLQCANMTLPIDWEAPGSSNTFNLAMVKLPRSSNSSGKGLGPLFVNPGGPGGAAVAFVSAIARGMARVSPEILENFDIIGVDPRGVGESTRIICDPAIWNERASQFPTTKEDYDRLVSKNERLGESCLNMTGPLFNYVDTISAARDHEAVRLALGTEMNWLGLSYGSQLGAQYAQLFPDNIRTMVLDGIVQHSQSEASNILIETTAYSVALQKFFDWANTDDSSPLKGQNAEQLWYDILRNATETPIPVPSCENPESCFQDVTEDEIRLNAQGALISSKESSRLTLANALINASQGDARPFAPGRANEGDPSMYAGLAIGCQDWSVESTAFDVLQAKMRLGEVFAPLTKGASQSWTLQASCMGWPAPRRNPPAKLDVKTKEPILLVNSLRDPSTSYTWAVGMLGEIQNSVLLTRNGDGHTSWGKNGSTSEAINHYLITKELPAPGTVLDN